jgi:hypothetical protein
LVNSWVGKLQFHSSDSFVRGLDYLYVMRGLALDPEMVDLMFDPNARSPICTWIGDRIDQVNASLQQCLQACHHCFHTADQPAIQIFAVPLASRFGIDGLCNLSTTPITLLIDVGRVMPQDWLALVAHEYAHAHAGSPGHHVEFARSLAHLCLGLAIASPPTTENHLRVHPPYRATSDPLAFWRGESEWRSSVADYYISKKPTG